MSSQWYLNHFSGVLYSESDKIPRIPIHGNSSVLKSIASKGEQIANCENPSLWSFVKSDSYMENIKKFSEEFMLTKFSVSEDELKLYGAKPKSPELTVASFSKEIYELKVSGYNVVSTWLKFRSFVYTRNYFSKDDFHDLLSFLCAVETQITLLKNLDDFLEVEFNDSSQWV
jgi:hypothetical protein